MSKLTRHPCVPCNEETIFANLICTRCGTARANPLMVGWDKVKKAKAKIILRYGKEQGHAVLKALKKRTDYQRNMELKAKGIRRVDVPLPGLGSHKPKSGRTPTFRK